MFNFAPAIPARSDVDWCWYLRRQGKPGEVLERILHDIGVMDPGGWAAWAPSSLTTTGSPVEMIFQAGQTDLQMVTEVANPQDDPTNRVALVNKIMQGRGGRQLPGALRDVISAAQSAGGLTYGARLGLRHGKAGLQCQLLAELPAAATDLSGLIGDAAIAAAMERLGDNARASMVSFDGGSGDVTLHFDMNNATRDDLAVLAEPAKVSPEILAMAMDGLSGATDSRDLPTRKLGISYRMRDGNHRPELTLSMCSATIFGSDADIAKGIKASGGYQLTGYAALVDNLPPASVPGTHHGKIGMTARQGAAPQLSIGVAAPWTCIFDAG